MRDKNFIIALLLTFSSGFCDSFSYLLCDGVFTTMQTGNIIKLMLIEFSLLNVLKYLLPIISFIIGILIANILSKGKVGKIICDLLIIIFLVTVFFLPSTKEFMIIANCMLSIIFAIIFDNEKNSCTLNYTPTMCTNNLRLFTVDLYNFFNKKKGTKCLFYLIIVSSFAIGCLVGRLTIGIIDRYSIFIILGIYLITMIINLVFKKQDSKIEHIQNEN